LELFADVKFDWSNILWGAKGKKRMKMIGQIEVSQEAFFTVMRKS